jgi:hypothetical protein
MQTLREVSTNLLLVLVCARRVVLCAPVDHHVGLSADRVVHLIFYCLGARVDLLHFWEHLRRIIKNLGALRRAILIDN